MPPIQNRNLMRLICMLSLRIHNKKAIMAQMQRKMITDEFTIQGLSYWALKVFSFFIKNPFFYLMQSEKDERSIFVSRQVYGIYQFHYTLKSLWIQLAAELVWFLLPSFGFYSFLICAAISIMQSFVCLQKPNRSKKPWSIP